MFDRLARAAAALGLLGSALAAPLPLAARIGLAVAGAYAAVTVVAGRCVGVTLLGLTACPPGRRPLGCAE